MPLEWLCRSALPVHSWGCLAWIQLQPFHKQKVWTLNAICKHSQTPPPACLQATRCGQEWHKLHTKYTFDVELKACSHGAWTARRPPPCWLPLQECGCNHRPRKANTLHSSSGREGKQVASPHTHPVDTRHAPSPHRLHGHCQDLKDSFSPEFICGRVKFRRQFLEPMGHEKQSKAGEFSIEHASHREKCCHPGWKVATVQGRNSSVHQPGKRISLTLPLRQGTDNTEASWAEGTGLNKKLTLGRRDAWKDPGFFLPLENHLTLSQLAFLGWRHFFITPKSFCKCLSPLPTQRFDLHCTTFFHDSTDTGSFQWSREERLNVQIPKTSGNLSSQNLIILELQRDSVL